MITPAGEGWQFGGRASDFGLQALGFRSRQFSAGEPGLLRCAQNTMTYR